MLCVLWAGSRKKEHIRTCIRPPVQTWRVYVFGCCDSSAASASILHSFPPRSARDRPHLSHSLPQPEGIRQMLEAADGRHVHGQMTSCADSLQLALDGRIDSHQTSCSCEP